MPTPKFRSAARALAGAAAALWLTPAYPHAVCGDRIFPSTQVIDDPGVTDELTLPSLTWLPKNSDGVQEFDAGAEWAKTIFPNFAISVGAGATWLHPGGYGWDALDTEAKYQFMCIPQLELMGSVGFDIEWGGSASGSQIGEPNMYSPVLDVGLGFGALPQSMNLMRPFAITAEISTTSGPFLCASAGFAQGFGGTGLRHHAGCKSMSSRSVGTAPMASDARPTSQEELTALAIARSLRLPTPLSRKAMAPKS
jgi:hypothetical protein